MRDIKIGDIMYYKFIEIEKVVITKIYPNTNRYKIDKYNWIIAGLDLYESPEGFFDKRISMLKEDLNKLENDRKESIDKFRNSEEGNK